MFLHVYLLLRELVYWPVSYQRLGEYTCRQTASLSDKRSFIFFLKIGKIDWQKYSAQSREVQFCTLFQVTIRLYGDSRNLNSFTASLDPQKYVKCYCTVMKRIREFFSPAAAISYWHVKTLHIYYNRILNNSTSATHKGRQSAAW
jgi:hypothetical protein